MRKPSLYPQDDGCLICHSPYTETHHVFPGHGRRQVSDEEGCTVRLCHNHHNGSVFGVHFDRKLDQWLRRDCQRRWEEREGLEGEEAHDAFRARFGISYL